MGTWERLTCGLMLSCVALDSQRNFSDPQFHHCKNGEDTQMLVKINEVYIHKVLRGWPHSYCSENGGAIIVTNNPGLTWPWIAFSA